MDAALYTARSAGLSTRQDRSYEDLKTRLLLGDFPLNARLGEERLAALLGVSRTPVREALLRLFAENLVDRHPDGGFCPTAPDVAGMQDLYEARQALELEALYRPARLGIVHDASVLEPLRDQWRALASAGVPPDPGFVLLDESFHVRLAEAAGNATLADLLRVVNERIRVVRMHDFLTAERVTRTIAQHIAIVEPVLAGDLPAAGDRFRRHLEESMAVVEQRATRALARMATRKGAMQP